MKGRVPLPGTLIYDRDCELCRWSQQVLARWDRAGRIRYLAFQDPLFLRWFPDYNLDIPPRAMLFIDAHGTVREGFDAFRRLLPCLPGGRFLFPFLYLPGMSWLGQRFYEWIARNRYRFR
jgi:predicted DCC family thiol-disulfide oxidoreductase YuxK